MVFILNKVGLAPWVEIDIRSTPMKKVLLFCHENVKQIVKISENSLIWRILQNNNSCLWEFLAWDHELLSRLWNAKTRPIGDILKEQK